MHQGGRWTHKRPGEEVWAYDVGGKRLLQRIALPHDATFSAGDGAAVAVWLPTAARRR